MRDLTRNWTHIPCIAKRSSNHWTGREDPRFYKWEIDLNSKRQNKNNCRPNTKHICRLTGWGRAIYEIVFSGTIYFRDAEAEPQKEGLAVIFFLNIYILLKYNWLTMFQVHSKLIHLYIYVYTYEGNGNPLQCSCLENPRDGGAWWAAIYGVAQSWTRLKRLQSSSNSIHI